MKKLDLAYKIIDHYASNSNKTDVNPIEKNSDKKDILDSEKITSEKVENSSNNGTKSNFRKEKTIIKIIGIDTKNLILNSMVS